jgi:hypothetical protein
MSRPLVHRMVHKRTALAAVRNGPARSARIRSSSSPSTTRSWSRVGQTPSTSGPSRRSPVHLDDIVVELTEADKNWLTANAIAWSGGVAR